jgi:hypothetical protein
MLIKTKKLAAGGDETRQPRVSNRSKAFLVAIAPAVPAPAIAPAVTPAAVGLNFLSASAAATVAVATLGTALTAGAARTSARAATRGSELFFHFVWTHLPLTQLIVGNVVEFAVHASEYCHGCFPFFFIGFSFATLRW